MARTNDARTNDDRDPDVQRLQKLRKKLEEGVRNGTFTPASALSYLQHEADRLARMRKVRTIRSN